MRRFVFAALTCLLASTLNAQNARFPMLTADDLNGRSVTLPAQLPGEKTIVFIAYKQRQQAMINAWIDALGLDATRGAEFVELPVVGSAAKAMRPIIDNGMRSGITDTAMRARTITIYQNASVVNNPLGFSGRGTIRVLVVRRDGTVLLSTSGAVTADGVKAVQAAYQN